MGANKRFSKVDAYNIVTETMSIGGMSTSIVPVGAIIPWMGGYFGNGSNGSFTDVLGNTVAAVNTYLGTSGWKVCDGTVPNDAASPIYNAAGRYLPNLTDSRFLMGNTTAGSIGGSNTLTDHTHTDTFSLSAENLNHGHADTFSLSTENLNHGHADTFANVASNSGAHTHGVGTYDIGTNNQNHSHAFYDQWSTGRDDGGSLVAGFPGAGNFGSTRTQSANHDHTISGTSGTASSDTHNHTLNGSVSTSTTLTSHNHTVNGAVSTSTTLESHNHTISGSVGTGVAPSSTENRPVYLSCFYIQRIK